MNETICLEEVNQPPSCLCKILPRFLDCPNSCKPLNLGLKIKIEISMVKRDTLLHLIEYSPFKALNQEKRMKNIVRIFMFL